MEEYVKTIRIKIKKRKKKEKKKKELLLYNSYKRDARLQYVLVIGWKNKYKQPQLLQIMIYLLLHLGSRLIMIVIHMLKSP